MSAQRYSMGVRIQDGKPSGIKGHPDPRGEWVRAEDCDKLRAELEWVSGQRELYVESIASVLETEPDNVFPDLLPMVLRHHKEALGEPIRERWIRSCHEEGSAGE